MIGNHCKRCLSRIRNSAALNCIGCIAPCTTIGSLLSLVFGCIMHYHQIFTMHYALCTSCTMHHALVALFIRSLLSFVSPPQTKGFSPFHQVLPVPLIPYQKEILVGFKTDKDIFYGTRIHHGYVHCIFALLDVFSAEKWCLVLFNEW